MDKTHYCYVITSTAYNRSYIGYTVDFPRRLRQHNGEITGGAKKTSTHGPWKPICLIEGFDDNHMALRFEYHLQHPHRRKKKGQKATEFIIENLSWLIDQGDGSIKKGNKSPWPVLTIHWYDHQYMMHHNHVINQYVT